MLWVGMFVLVAVWTSFLTKSIKDSKVVFLLGFGIHELFFYHLHTLRHMRRVSISIFSFRDKVTLRLLKLYLYIVDVGE